MSVLAVVSPKGGVGKTTVALNLAYAFAVRGRRVLLLDADPQGGIGLSLVGRAKDAPGLAELVHGAAFDQVVVRTRLERLHLVSAGHVPWARIGAYVDELGPGGALAALVDEVSARYDLVVIDTASGLYGPTLGALHAATHVLLPLQTEPLALRAVPQMMEVLRGVHEAGHIVALTGVVLTMARLRDEVSLAITQEAWGAFPPDLVLETHIPRDPAFVAASAKGVPVGLLRRRPPPSAAVFDRVAAELEGRLGFYEGTDGDEATPLVD